MKLTTLQRLGFDPVVDDDEADENRAIQVGQLDARLESFQSTFRKEMEGALQCWREVILHGIDDMAKRHTQTSEAARVEAAKAAESFERLALKNADEMKKALVHSFSEKFEVTGSLVKRQVSDASALLENANEILTKATALLQDAAKLRQSPANPFEDPKFQNVKSEQESYSKPVYVGPQEFAELLSAGAKLDSLKGNTEQLPRKIHIKYSGPLVDEPKIKALVHKLPSGKIALIFDASKGLPDIADIDPFEVEAEKLRTILFGGLDVIPESTPKSSTLGAAPAIPLITIAKLSAENKMAPSDEADNNGPKSSPMG